MINPGFILIPLYIYPSPGAWDPLFNAAKAYPDVTFAAIVNPDNGPGAGSCPNSDYISAIASLNAISNIKSLAYVHTADAYDCGSGHNEICTCSQPLSAVETNITTYHNWPTAGCSTNNAQDIHIDGIFFDESPSNDTCVSYMQSLTNFAKSTLTTGNTVLFNAGSSVDAVYWGIADYINVLENSEAAYYSADIGSLDGDGEYHSQATFIIYDYTSGSATEQRDVDTILNDQHDSIAGLYITDLSVYSAFPTNWTGFVELVSQTLSAN